MPGSPPRAPPPPPRLAAMSSSSRWRAIALAAVAGGAVAVAAWWIMTRWRDGSSGGEDDAALTSALLRVLRCVQTGDAETEAAIEAAGALLKKRRSAAASHGAAQLQADCVAAAVNGAHVKALALLLEGGFPVREGGGEGGACLLEGGFPVKGGGGGVMPALNPLVILVLNGPKGSAGPGGPTPCARSNRNPLRLAAMGVPQYHPASSAFAVRSTCRRRAAGSGGTLPPTTFYRPSTPSICRWMR
jgi:hypothetical protein